MSFCIFCFTARTKKSSYEFTSNGKANIKEYEQNGSSCDLAGETTLDYSFNKDKKELTLNGETVKLHSFTGNELSFPIDAGQLDVDEGGTPDIVISYYNK
jgi:hypothetical protein